MSPFELIRAMTAKFPVRVLRKLFWVGDIPYVWTAEGWAYLPVLLDLFSGRVVGWAFAERMRRDLPLSAQRLSVSAPLTCSSRTQNLHHMAL